MGTYEQRLSEFAEYKRLLRLPRPVRDRADACCDACGSTQPRMLYGLKDPDSGRYYFVGNTCLKELVKRGAVLKRFGKESGRVAYEAEMGRRTQEGDQVPAGEVNGAGRGTPSSKSEPSASDTQASHEPDSSPLIPGILVVEAPEHYQAYAFVLTPHGTTRSWGHSVETRFEDAWQRGGERGIVLEKVKKERPDALGRAIAGAWRQACARFEGSEPLPPLLGLDNETHQGEDILVSMFTALVSVGSADVGGAGAPAPSNGHLKSPKSGGELKMVMPA